MKSTLPDSDLNQTFGKAGVGRKNLATLPERRFMGLFTLLVALLVLSTGNAQISYSSAASDYTQNFNDLLSPVPSNGTLIAPSVLPGGWQFVEAGANANGSANLRVDNGTSSTGDTFFYGATSSNERALGSYASGSLTSQYGAVFTNDTGAPLTQFTLTYTGEQWRDGGNASAVFNKLTFAYAINSSSVTSGTFTNVSNLDFTAPVNNTTADAAKDGNAAGFRTTLTYTVTGINWPAGQNLVIRWTDINDAGNDDGLAIDDITFSATGASVPAIATIGTLSAVNTTYGTASPTPTSYTVSGSNLGTTDITITAPAGFEISKNGATGTYATSQTLTPASGSVATTTIYVRLAATTPAGTYSGNITHISGTATSDKATASSTVAQKGLTVSGATAQNKTYDRTIAATITGATPVGTVNGDAITLTGGGTFGDFLVENGKAVTSNLVVSGTNASSYALAQPTGLTADITPKDLTLSSVSASDKTYDGSNEAILTATLNGVISPDEVVLNASASFANSFVANNIPVTSFSTIFGADAANYNLIQPSGLTADITAKALTILNATAQNKVYDGNTTAVITGTLDGVIAPDDVVLTLQGTFASPEVGLGIAVTSTSFITGDISNYTLTQPTGLTANISAGELLDQTITFAALADVTYGTAAFNLTASASSNLTVSYSSSNENVATVSGNVVTVLNAGSTTITATQTGDLTYDSAEPVAQALMVLPKELTITSATAQNKEYDGNDDAVITGTLSGVINSDDVTVTLSADFATAFVGTDIEVTSTSTLGGTEVSNYTLSQPTGLNADITAKTLTVENAVASDKPYDGNPIATIIGGDLIGIVNNDDVSLSNADGLFATSDAAINIEVTTAFTLTGSAATNYALTQPTGLFADITPLQVTVFGVTAQNKVYDGNANATVSGTPELDGVLAGDTVTVSGTPTGLFDNKNVGTSKPITVSGYTLSGAQAGNYTAIQPTDVSADITPASLTILNAQAVDKSFDGTTAATITGTLQGVISPDVATLVGTGTFAQSAIGTDIAVTSTSTVGGAAGLNYIINPQPTGLTADIVAGPSILAIGDLSILGFQYNAPDTFAFVTWVDLAENTIIKFTDNAFLSSGSANATNNARGGENFVIWRNNGAVIPAGTVIRLVDNNGTANATTGTIVSGNLDGLSASGDAIFAYQGAATSGNNPDYTSNANPTTFNGTILFGLYAQASSSITTWLTTGTASSQATYLPSQLNVANGNIALGASATRGQYTGSRTNQTSFAAYRTLVNNPANWTTAPSSGTVTLNTTPFTLVTGPTASVITGGSTICAGENTQFSVSVTGGTSPFTVVYSDGTSQFTLSGYVSGTVVTVNPTTTTTYSIVSVTDANSLAGTNNSGSVLVTVNQLYPFYVDGDFDGFGAGNPVSVCAVDANTPPSGYSVTNTDCNDAVAAIYPGASEVPFNGIDDDCDGTIDEGSQITTQVLASQCGTTLTAINSSIGATAVAAPVDGYRFRVVNTTTNEVQTLDRTTPNFQLTALANYEYATTYSISVMLRRNGVWLNYYGSSCLVSTPAVLSPGGAAAVTPSQCGITLPSISTLIATTSLQGVTGYRFRITNVTDNTAPNQVQTLDRVTHWFSLTMLGTYAYGTTYTIEVALKTGNSSTYSGYGAPCSISTPIVPVITNPGVANTTTALFYTTSMNRATSYRFELTLAQSPFTTIIVDRASHYFSFSNVPGYVPGGQYAVRVAVMTSGIWSPFGEAELVTAPGATRGMFEEETAPGIAFRAVAYPNPYIEGFALDMDTPSDAQIQVKVYDMTGKLLEDRNVSVDAIEVQQFGTRLPSGVYNVIVTQGSFVKTLRMIKR